MDEDQRRAGIASNRDIIGWAREEGGAISKVYNDDSSPGARFTPTWC